MTFGADSVSHVDSQWKILPYTGFSMPLLGYNMDFLS